MLPCINLFLFFEKKNFFFFTCLIFFKIMKTEKNIIFRILFLCMIAFKVLNINLRKKILNFFFNFLSLFSFLFYENNKNFKMDFTLMLLKVFGSAMLFISEFFEFRYRNNFNSFFYDPALFVYVFSPSLILYAFAKYYLNFYNLDLCTSIYVCMYVRYVHMYTIFQNGMYFFVYILNLI